MRLINIFVFLFLSSLCSASVVEEALEPYKHLLEWGTYAEQDWSLFSQLPASRYDSFKFAFEHFENNQGKVIVELGTSRSFRHGGLIGCNLDDVRYWNQNQPENWDWGAGFFSRMVLVALRHCQPEFHTVDISVGHINRCKLMLSDLHQKTFFHVTSSVEFLKKWNPEKKIDLIYVDTGDMTPIEPTALMQLEEVKLIVERGLLSENGVILIDDVRNQTPRKFGENSELGKAKYSYPYLIKQGYKAVVDGYQVVFQ